MLIYAQVFYDLYLKAIQRTTLDSHPFLYVASMLKLSNSNWSFRSFLKYFSCQTHNYEPNHLFYFSHNRQCLLLAMRTFKFFQEDPCCLWHLARTTMTIHDRLYAFSYLIKSQERTKDTKNETDKSSPLIFRKILISKYVVSTEDILYSTCPKLILLFLLKYHSCCCVFWSG